MPKQADMTATVEQSEVQRLMALDTTPWYKKPNLRFLYFCLVPAAMGVEMTTGYDGSVLNGLQAVQTWQDREFHSVTVSLAEADIFHSQTLEILKVHF